MFSRRAVGAFATTLMASTLGLSGCASQSTNSAEPAEQPLKVAAAMQTSTNTTSISEEATVGPARETTLTAQGFAQYIDEEQRAALLGDGLDLNTLSWANQVTAFRVLESLFNEDAFKVVSAVLRQVAHNPEAQAHHFLKFSPEPSLEEPWTMTLDGPTVGMKVTFSPDGQIAFDDAYLGLSATDVENIESTLDTPEEASSIKTSAENLLDSLDDSQKAALQGAGLSGSRLNDEQKELFLQMTSNWIVPADGDASNDQRELIAETLDDTVIVWKEQPDGSAYLKVSGPEIDFHYEENLAQGIPSINTSFQIP